MTSVLIALADQNVVGQLRAHLSEIDEVELQGVASDTRELSQSVLRHQIDVVFVHEGLGPGSVHEVIRDLALRRPQTVFIYATNGADSAGVVTAMEAGARAVLTFPLVFEEVVSRISLAEEWGQQIRKLTAAGEAQRAEEATRGKVVVIAGAKGGVGATTVATHLALHLHHNVARHKTLLVDLDILAGDVACILETVQRVSIADLARVSDDLARGAVQDAIVVHESGLHLLLAPQDVVETEDITPEAIRSILSEVRREYDTVIVDAGAHVTPVQAAAIEFADQPVLIAGSEVLSLRSMQRCFTAWNTLGVANESDVVLLLNRTSKSDMLPARSVQQLTRARVLPVFLPEAYRRLEPGINARDPRAIVDNSWWSGIAAVARELQLGDYRAPKPGKRAVPATAPGTETSTNAGPTVVQGRQPLSRRLALRREKGQVVIENVALIPLICIVVMLMWQAGIVAWAFVNAGHAASESSRQYGISKDLGRAHDAAVDSLPGPLRSGTQVAAPRAGEISVSVPVPLVIPGEFTLPGSRITVTKSFVEEPRS